MEGRRSEMRHAAGLILVVAVGVAAVFAVAGSAAGQAVSGQRGFDAADVMVQLREGPYIRTLPRGGARRLGVAVLELTPQLADYFGTKEGVLIASVRDWSPADRAGLKAGDVITAVDGIAVGTEADFTRVLHRDLTSAELSITVTRYLRKQRIEVNVPPYKASK
jgi:serine protease Do